MTFKITALGYAAGRFTSRFVCGFFHTIYRISFVLANFFFAIGMRAAERRFRGSVRVKVIPPEGRAQTLPGPRP